MRVCVKRMTFPGTKVPSGWNEPRVPRLGSDGQVLPREPAVLPDMPSETAAQEQRRARRWPVINGQVRDPGPNSVPDGSCVSLACRNATRSAPPLQFGVTVSEPTGPALFIPCFADSPNSHEIYTRRSRPSANVRITSYNAETRRADCPKRNSAMRVLGLIRLGGEKGLP